VVQLAAQRLAPLRTSAAFAVAIWAALIGIGVALGAFLNMRHRHIVLPTPPILGSFVTGVRAGVLLPGAVAIALVVLLPRVVERASWRALLVLVPLCALAWTSALALAEGTSGFTRGPSWHSEYLTDVPAVRADPAGFLRGFTDNIARYDIHVRGHPPGMVLLLAGLDRLGLGGAAWEAALVIAVAATAPIAVLIAIRALAGERTARRAAAFLVLAPAAIWIATSADALYMAVGAWAVTLVVLAMCARRVRRQVAFAALGGLLGGLALLGSYGLVLLAAIPAGALWSRRADRARVLRVALAGTAGAVAVLLAFLPFGYWWLDGLRATKHEYVVLDLDRPYWAFLFINLGAFALALGPATFMGLAALRDKRLWLLVGGGLSAAALAELSGLSSGEVERIWLPFTLWVLPAGAAVVTTRASTRTALAMQAASAIAIISVVTTQW
jgi:hypothetical protein